MYARLTTLRARHTASRQPAKRHPSALKSCVRVSAKQRPTGEDAMTGLRSLARNGGRRQRPQKPKIPRPAGASRLDAHCSPPPCCCAPAEMACVSLASSAASPRMRLRAATRRPLQCDRTSCLAPRRRLCPDRSCVSSAPRRRPKAATIHARWLPTSPRCATGRLSRTAHDTSPLPWPHTRTRAATPATPTTTTTPFCCPRTRTTPACASPGLACMSTWAWPSARALADMSSTLRVSVTWNSTAIAVSTDSRQHSLPTPSTVSPTSSATS